MDLVRSLSNLTMRKIKTVTVTGSVAATIDFENIPQRYRHLALEASTLNDTGGANILMRFSTDGTTFDSGNNYDWQYLLASAAAPSSAETLATSSLLVGGNSTAAQSACSVRIPDYATATIRQPVIAFYARKDGTSTGNLFVGQFAGFWRNNTDAIKGIRLLLNSGNFAVGSVATLYGLPG